MKKIHKIATCCAIGIVSLVGGVETAKAAVVPVAGIDLVLNDFYSNIENLELDVNDIISSSLPSEYKDIAIAKVNNYVNVRSEANIESEIVGKLHNNSAATIQEKVGDWYKVTSGNVTGYINGDFLVVGKDAEELVKEVGTRIATVKVSALNVRREASIGASILTLSSAASELIVVEEQGEWIKVKLESGTQGYVSADFVELKTTFQEAISMEEERQRIAAERATAEREAAERAAAARAAENRQATSSARSTTATQSQLSSGNSTNSSLRQNIVQFARKYEGNLRYVWGGTSLSSGVDCSGFTQSVFRNFGISIPRTSRQQASGGRTISISNIQPGDLVFYDRNGTINHVAIYLGNGQVISASSERFGVRITNINYRTPVRVVSYIR